MVKDKLRQLRYQHQYTQESLAEKLNVSRQTVSNWENGKSKPDYYNLKMLDQIYDGAITKYLNESLDDATIDSEKEDNKINREKTFFAVLITLSSFLIPLGSLVAIYILFEWKNELPKLLHKILLVFITIFLLVKLYITIGLFLSIFSQVNG